MKRTNSPYYYYASGRRYDLDLDPDLVAVEQRATASLGVGEGAARVLPGGLRLVSKRDYPAVDAAAAEGASGVQPVFSHDGATIVVLPEVRVEVDRTQQSRLAEVVSGTGIAATVDAQDEYGVVIRPDSGRGLDALQLANVIHEQLHPPLAQARFLRVVAKTERR